MAIKTSNAPRSEIDDLLAYNRYVAVTSAAFEMQEVTLLSMIGVEQLGEPFRYDVRVVCRKRIRNFTKVVGQPLTVGLKLTDGRTRYFNGIVRNFSYVGLDYTRRPIYLAEVVPWIAVLEFRRNSRIFQNMTSLEIAKQIFAEHKASDFQDLTLTKPPKRVFCVQYDETDYAFVSRLLEQDGIYYYFIHQANRHEMVLADSAAAHEPCKPQVIPTNLSLERHKIHDDIFWEWGENVSLRPGEVAMDDYDHEKPRANLAAKAPVPAMKTGGVPTLNEERAFDRLSKGPSGEQQAMTTPGPDAAQRELYFYPGRYTNKADGDFYAKVRSEEIGCRAYRVRVTGGARQLCHGHLFVASNPYEITDTQIAPKPTDAWLAVRAEIDIRGETDKEAGPDAPPPYTLYADAPPAYTPTAAPPPYTPQPASADDEPYLYHCTVEAQPAGNQFRPPLRTPRPVISGPQTAVVVGRPGETITTDKYGRIKVQFFWDRKGVKDENSSCWIRVAQNWAGKNFGGLVTPRVGQEVVVEFINGNPDWPLVTGCVYNDDNMPPEDLPAQAPRSTFKTRTVDGLPAQYNELMFDDRRGGEEIQMTSSVGSITVTAAKFIKLVVAGSSIEITPEAITLISPLVKIGPVTDVMIGPVAAAIEIGPVGGAIEIGPVVGDVNIGPTAAFTVEATSVTLLTPDFFAVPPIPPVV